MPFDCPAEYHGHPNSRDIAEAYFLKALRRPRLVERRVGRLPLRHGFTAKPSGAPLRKSTVPSMIGAATDARAIRPGAQEAQRCDDEAREAAQDSTELRELGFDGRDADED